MPLALLKKNCISFSPGLSEGKRDAIARLGAGLIEKILLRYDTKWWSYKIGGADFFGSIEMTGSDSGVDAEDEQDWIFIVIEERFFSKYWLVLKNSKFPSREISRLEDFFMKFFFFEIIF